LTEALDRLVDEVAEQGWPLNKPATATALKNVDTWFRERTGSSLPDAHLTFLARTDGLDFNGAVLYATHDGRTTAGLFVAGIIESNERYGDSGGTWIGEANGDLFGLASGAWVIADMVSRQVYSQYDDCAALLAHVLRKYLDA
jgi:hypothetical protein